MVYNKDTLKGGDKMAHEQRLKAFIKARGISQTFIAQKIGMKPVTFNNILNGRGHLRTDVLEKVCNVIGAKPAEFFSFKTP
jgi:transcriptional regulator with XRE-family HTH domain